MLRREKKKASVSSIYLNMKPPYADKVVVKPYSVGYVTPKLQKFDASSFPRFHESHSYNVDLCMREFPKYLTISLEINFLFFIIFCKASFSKKEIKVSIA